MDLKSWRPNYFWDRALVMSASLFLVLFFGGRCFAQTLLCEIGGLSGCRGIGRLAKRYCKKSSAGSQCALEPRFFSRHGMDHRFAILLNPILFFLPVSHASDLSSQQTSHFDYAKQPGRLYTRLGIRGQCPRTN